MKRLLGGVLIALCACGEADRALCAEETCLFTADEWKQLKALADLPEAPPPDPSNKYATLPAAQTLGQKLYFDPRFSGNATLLDALRRPVPYARAAKGQPTNISCATCHDPARAGADFTSDPNYVSIGAGWYDVNGQQTVNAAYYGIIYWNGRNDSLWSQIVAVAESFVSMGSNRLKIAWLLEEKYKAEYEAVFTEWPLPFTTTQAAVLAEVEPNTNPDGTRNPLGGQCKLVAGACPADCRQVTGTDNAVSCWPRFPLEGRPGTTTGCQAGSAAEPFNDAFDCMESADQKLITRAYVNFSKAIAAYEQTLISRESAFDKWIAAGSKSNLLTDAQKRGAKVFAGKGSCIDCHNTPLFSDSKFHNVGVPQVGAMVPTEADCRAGGVCDCVNNKNCLPAGALDGLTKLHANGFRRDSAYSDDPKDTSHKPYLDLNLDASLRGTWRTPSLRDVELTAPYMHDGAYKTLEEVVWKYNLGGSTAEVVGTPSVQLKPLGLSDGEQADLVAFLKSLTGTPMPAEHVSAPVLPP